MSEVRNINLEYCNSNINLRLCPNLNMDFKIKHDDNKINVMVNNGCIIGGLIIKGDNNNINIENINANYIQAITKNSKIKLNRVFSKETDIIQNGGMCKNIDCEYDTLNLYSNTNYYMDRCIIEDFYIHKSNLTSLSTSFIQSLTVKNTKHLIMNMNFLDRANLKFNKGFFKIDNLEIGSEMDIVLYDKTKLIFDEIFGDAIIKLRGKEYNFKCRDSNISFDIVNNSGTTVLDSLMYKSSDIGIKSKRGNIKLNESYEANDLKSCKVFIKTYNGKVAVQTDR